MTMKVLVTGSEGLVGKAVCRALLANGHSFSGFDRTTSGDILDQKSLFHAAGSCDSVIHSAALLGVPGQTPQQIMAVNLQGTWNLLLAAKNAGIDKLVFLSSVDVLGVFKGERIPDFLPLDESHPCYPGTGYAISKCLGEEMCRLFTQANAMTITCLRPPGVWDTSTYEWVVAERHKRPSFEWDPFWEYGAFIDVRDLAAACLSALKDSITGFHSVFVSSDDITTSGRSSIELCQQLHPEVNWRGGSEYDEKPYRTLLNNNLAKQVLNWNPVHSWSNFDNR
jgi:nucleoside-diphosphate-sugar epimerase|tara:strand:- start:28 stop:870 length:843 start_codon:yes stop_codon:yes gene_type:complete